jgi:NADPH:quinone reductase-like Zn-dependent oxidoreductase
VRAYGFRAVGGPEQEAFLDVPEPVAGPGELLVAVRAAAVNPGDWRVREGSYGVTGPAVLGREVAGTVAALGPDVTGFTVGDEVFGGCPDMQGGFAPLARVTASFAARRPDGVTPQDAAALPVAAGTAWDALTGLDLPEGATLLVNGAGGGVGVVAVQLAAARGLRVVGTASPAKHDLIARLGGVPVAYGEGVAERVRALGGSAARTGDAAAVGALGGVDAVFDLVGGDALRAVAALCPPAKLRSVADKPLVKELGGDEVVRDRSTAVLDALAALVSQGRLDPLVGEVVPFADAPAAMRAVESGHTRGKVVLRLS